MSDRTSNQIRKPMILRTASTQQSKMITDYIRKIFNVLVNLINPVMGEYTDTENY